METKRIVGIVIAFLFVYFAISTLYAKEIDKKNSNLEADHKMDNEMILRAKFSSDFDQNPAFILLKIKNAETKSQMDIVCLNTQWRYYCINSLKLADNKSSYTDYMEKNYSKIFETPEDIYADLKKYEADDFYTSKYKTKEEFQKGIEAGDFSSSSEDDLKKDRAFIKLILKFSPLLRQKADGKIYEDNVISPVKQDSTPLVTKKTLKERFSDFSTSPIFVLIKIRNAETKEEAEITCENETWAIIATKKLKIVKNSKDYTNYMVKN